MSQIVSVSLVLSAIFLSACAPGTGDINQARACEPGRIGIARTLDMQAVTGPVEALLAPGEVVLTFDDGPHRARTLPVLALLAEECTAATFFLQGNHAAASPDLVRLIRLNGHTIGGHGWAHKDLTDMPVESARKDILRGTAAINAGLDALKDNRRVGLFRFPYVATNPELDAVLEQENLIAVEVSVDGQDWTDNSPEARVELIMTGLATSDRKGVVLLHDPFVGSAETVTLLLARLKAEDYRVVALKLEQVS